jgi:hypothetical protein
MPLTVTLHHYTNPQYQYGVFMIAGEVIGRADKVEGGWRLKHGRTIFETDELAAKALLDQQIAAARRQEAVAQKHLDALAMYCGGRLPTSARATSRR